jgi:hypothetical protein
MSFNLSHEMVKLAYEQQAPAKGFFKSETHYHNLLKSHVTDISTCSKDAAPLFLQSYAQTASKHKYTLNTLTTAESIS